MTTHKLTILMDGKPWIKDLEVLEANLAINTPVTERVHNPSLAAAMSGAPPETWRDLPGEMVFYDQLDGTVTLTYKIEYRLPPRLDKGSGHPRW